MSRRRKFKPQTQAPAANRAENSEKWALRRFEGAQTSRVNKNDWRGAFDQSINQDLGFDLHTLRARCHYEAENNPVIKGMINTYCNHMIGSTGPMLQVQSSNKKYNETLELAWRHFSKSADIRGLPLPELIRLWIRNWFLDGEILAIETSNPREGSPISFCLQTISPRRLADPIGEAPAEGNQIFMGVETDLQGRVKKYHIIDERILAGVTITDYKTTALPAARVHHVFIREEAEQLRGVPWLAPALPVIADMRKYDSAVLKAAHNAARLSMLMQTANPNIPFEDIPAGTSMDVKEDSIQAIPPGWALEQMKSTQPMAEYPAYRAERHRDIGRPVSMPLMILDLNSSQHSYSGGRLDIQVYGAELTDKAGLLERAILNDLVWRVEREAQLSMGLPQRPDDARLAWTWNQLPHVDPVKEATAERLELENGTLAFSQACARKGLDPEKVIEQRRVDAQRLQDAGLPPAPVATTSLTEITAIANQGNDNATAAA